MSRHVIALAALLAACQLDPTPEDTLTTTAQELGGFEVTRDHVAGDVYHYRFTVPVGSGPNARLLVHRVVRERAPWVPRRTSGAIVLLHGDFASFDTNFALPGTTGLAPWLAGRDIDAWGLDWRWNQAPAGEADLSDFGAMGLTQELDDLDVALAFARGVRLITGSGGERLTVGGFSRGGQIAYFHAARDATRPPGLRQVKGLVPIDVYASLAPEDEVLRQFNCDNAAWARDGLAAGEVDVPNDSQIELGRLALDDPEGPAPYFPGRTNRIALVIFTGRTHYFYPASPLYHLAAPVFEGGVVTGLRLSSEEDVGQWFARATPHQSLRESADTDGLVCGDAPLPVDLPLSNIRVPLFLLAAAGGYGDHSIHSTTQVSSTDVTTLVVRELPPEREAEDFGHGDLLYAPAAEALAWQPLLAWLRAH